MFKFNVAYFAKVFLLSMLVAAGITSAVAQEGTATLRGTIADPSGAVVAAATVSIVNRPLAKVI